MVILTASMEKKDFPALTGIRFVAASMVFIHHYARIVYTGKALDFGYYFMRQMNVGVNLFFVLSGFLIAHRYYAQTFAGGGFWLYWSKRIVRIFPLYYAVLIIYFLLFYHQHNRLPDAATIVLNVTLLKGLSNEYFLSGIAQAWSLTAEEMFYLYAPLAFLLIKRSAVFFLQIPLLIGAGLLLVGLASWLHQPAFFGDVPFLFAFTFFARCFEFFTRMYVALQIRKVAKEKKGMMLTASGVLACCLSIGALAYYAWQGNVEVINDHLIVVSLFNFLIPASFGLLFYGLVLEESGLKKILATKLLTLLGKSSYAFYLLHIGLFAEVFYFHVTRNVLVLYLLLQLCSIAAYKFFEKPVYFYLLNRFTSRRNRDIYETQSGRI